MTEKATKVKKETRETAEKAEEKKESRFFVVRTFRKTADKAGKYGKKAVDTATEKGRAFMDRIRKKGREIKPKVPFLSTIEEKVEKGWKNADERMKKGLKSLAAAVNLPSKEDIENLTGAMNSLHKKVDMLSEKQS